MCEHYDEDDFYSDVDVEDSYHWEDPLPRKIKYYPASPAIELDVRLHAYKAHKRFNKFAARISRMMVRGFNEKKKKLACLRIGTKYFMFEPISLLSEKPPAEYEYTGHHFQLRSGPHKLNLKAYLTVGKNQDLYTKYREMGRELTIRDNYRCVNICGMPFYFDNGNIEFGSSGHFNATVEFSYVVPYEYEQHADLLRHERARAERFRKFATLTRENYEQFYNPADSGIAG